MKALKEVTVWDCEYRQPNHVYLMEGDTVFAYIKWGQGQPEYLRTPLRIDRRGRRFEELKENPFERRAEPEPAFIVRVRGSKGREYEVNTEAKTCTCPGFTYRGACKHVQV